MAAAQGTQPLTNDHPDGTAPRGAGTELWTAADEAARLAGHDSSDWSTAAGDAGTKNCEVDTR